MISKAKQPRADAPLGVFDSGLGGLTVVRALRERCPTEDIVYLGDNARVPYGTRSAETVMRYARSCAGELTARGAKVVVVACNTVSAVAIEMLRAHLDLPVIGVIVPGARAAIEVAGDAGVGVLATAGTIASGAYTRAVASLNGRTEVIGQAAPLLVALAEEGWTEGEVPLRVVRRYLAPFFGPYKPHGLPCDAKVGCVVLGCTHFPLFRALIKEQLRQYSWRRDILVVDSAQETALEVDTFLRERKLANPQTARGRLEVLVTDKPQSFEAVASRFLGEPVDAVTLVDLRVG